MHIPLFVRVNVVFSVTGFPGCPIRRGFAVPGLAPGFAVARLAIPRLAVPGFAIARPAVSGFSAVPGPAIRRSARPMVNVMMMIVSAILSPIYAKLGYSGIKYKDFNFLVFRGVNFGKYNRICHCYFCTTKFC